MGGGPSKDKNKSYLFAVVYCIYALDVKEIIIRSLAERKKYTRATLATPNCYSHGNPDYNTYYEEQTVRLPGNQD
jgi:hypothetical protein